MSEYRPVANRSTLFMYLMLVFSAASLVYLFSGTSAPVTKAAKIEALATCGSCFAGGGTTFVPPLGYLRRNVEVPQSHDTAPTMRNVLRGKLVT